MSTRARTILAWSLAIAGPGGFVLAEALRVAFGLDANEDIGIFIPVLLGGAAMAVVGVLIATRTRNRIGWILLTIPATTAVALLGVVSYQSGVPDGTTWATWAYWFSQWPFFLSLILLVSVFYLFPTGTIASARWRWPWRVYLISGAITIVGFMILPYDVQEGGPRVSNPIGIPALEGVLSPLLAVAGLMLVLSAFLAFVSLVTRYRSATADERQQLRWLFLVGAIGAPLLATLIMFSIVTGDAQTGTAARIADIMMILLATDVVVGIPVATGIAILKYRLYEIDVVIKKTIVYGALVLFTTLVYVAIVVGLGAVIGATEGSLPLSIAATALVAVMFQPVRELAQRLANRIVYGHRASPYEVLARFSDRVGGAYATEDVLSRMSRVLAESVHAASATIWLRVADRWEAAAAWPRIEGEASDPPSELPGDRVTTVTYRDETLGALAVTMPPDEPLTPEGAQLVDDLAGQAGIVLSNVRLTADLEARLSVIARQAEELRASRRRIVAAQDAERRRLERNIHDGAQQHLVALAVKLRLARGMLAKDPERARAMLGELRDQIDAALDTLHALALGIYPPHLEAEGIAAALRAQYERSAVPVRLHADDIARYPIETEAAVYFCVLEGLQNASKYASASSIDVTLDERDGSLWFEVADDGVGFDLTRNGDGTGLAGMRDRLAVFGGDADLESAPGRGTRVRGRVPLTEGAPA